jgi:transposase
MPGRPVADHRRVVEGIIYRFRCGLAWCDVPVEFGPWQTCGSHCRYAGDGTWERALAALPADVGSAGLVGWTVGADSSIIRATSTLQASGEAQGAGSNYNNLRVVLLDHARGCSRGGVVRRFTSSLTDTAAR